MGETKYLQRIAMVFSIIGIIISLLQVSVNLPLVFFFGGNAMSVFCGISFYFLNDEKENV